MSSSSHHLIVATISSLSYLLSYQSVLALSEKKILHVEYEPNK